MSIDFKITRKFNDGCVQVEAGRKNRVPNYYKVPENRVDEFEKEYKKNSKKIAWISAGTLTAAIIAVLLPVTHFSQKITNKTLRGFLNILAGVVGGTTSMIVNNKIEMNSHSKLLKKYNAEVIDYSKNKLNLE